MRRIRWAAVLAATALAAGACGSATAHPGNPGNPTTRPATASAPGRTTAQNKAAARAEAARLLRAVPLPPGGRRLTHSPMPGLRSASVGVGPSDPTMSRHTWWTVPMTSAAFARWLRHHRPHGMTSEGVASTTAQGFTSQDLTFDGRGTGAYSTPYLNFGFTACRDTLPHMQRLAVYTGEALDELERACGVDSKRG